MEKLNPKAFFATVVLLVIISCSGTVTETLKTTPSHTLESGYDIYLTPYNTNVTIEYFTGKEWISQNFENASYVVDSIKTFNSETGRRFIPMNSVHQILANKSGSGTKFWSGYGTGFVVSVIGGIIIMNDYIEHLQQLGLLIAGISGGAFGLVAGGPIFGLINMGINDGVFTVNEKADVESFYQKKQIVQTPFEWSSENTIDLIVRTTHYSNVNYFKINVQANQFLLCFNTKDSSYVIPITASEKNNILNRTIRNILRNKYDQNVVDHTFSDWIYTEFNDLNLPMNELAASHPLAYEKPNVIISIHLYENANLDLFYGVLSFTESSPDKSGMIVNLSQKDITFIKKTIR